MRIGRALRKISALGLLAVTLFLGACGDAGVAPDADAQYSYRAPPDIGDGLGGSSASNRGVDSEPLTRMVQETLDGVWPNLHSMLVYRSGDLLLEEYFPGTMLWDGQWHEFSRAERHDVFSVTKSFTSAGVGLAIADGFISGVDASVMGFFPEYADLGHADLKLRDLLSMSSGIRWDEWTTPYGHPANDHSLMNEAPSQIAYVLEQESASAPGETFRYNSGLSLILGEIVARATGERLADYVQRELFAPLGITGEYWYYYPSGIAHAGGGLHLRPRDMAKFGVLYLNGGTWAGERIVPEAWVATSTEQHAADRAYGFQWWLDSWQVGDRSLDGFSAQGLAGQYIFVVPELDLVAVFTGNNEGSQAFSPFQLMTSYVLPAVN